MLPSFNYSFFVIPTTKVTSAVDHSLDYPKSTNCRRVTLKKVKTH